MSRMFAAAVLLAGIATGAARTAAPEKDAVKTAPNKVVAVTVYPTTALVTREVTLPEAAGPAEVVVSPLPPQAVDSSLYSEGTGEARVLSTRFRARAVYEDTREDVRKLEATLKTLADTQAKLESELEVIKLNLALLAKLEGFTGATLATLTEKGQLNSEATIALTTFITDGRAKRAKEQLAATQALAVAKEEAAFAKRQLDETSGGKVRTERDAVIVIDKPAGAAKVRLNYLVNQVSWRPHYRVRAGKEKEPVGVEYLAALFQQTGEDWSNVALTLSTAQPTLNAAPPELAALDVAATPLAPGQQAAGPMGMTELKSLELQSRALRGQSQMAYNNLQLESGGKAVNSAAALEQYRDLVGSKDELFRSARVAREEGPTVTYHLQAKNSVPTRSEEQVIEIARLELAPDYFYKAVPVLTPHVYRQATLVNRSELVLLAGEATMYQGTDFVGRQQLPLVAIGKTFTVGFGVDPQISVTRELQDRTRTTNGGNQVVKFDYRILAQSYKATPVKLQVWDRLPHAEGTAINVSLVSQKPDLSGDSLYARDERPKNLLRWDVDLQPGQNRDKPLTIDYSYRLEMALQVTIGAFQAR